MSERAQVYVVKLDDAVGPRRRRDRPNVFVGITVQDPVERFEQLRRGTKRKHWYADHVVKLRRDLFKGYPPTTRAQAERQEPKLVAKLRRRGYTVNRCTKVWRVYVGELDAAGVGDLGKGYVYVGETSKTPEERWAEHVAGRYDGNGPVFSRVVHHWGRRLLPELYEHLPPLMTAEDSLKAEAALAEELRERGYRVEGGL